MSQARDRHEAGGKQTSSTLKMEAKCFFETSADFQRTTGRYIPEDTTLQLLFILASSLLTHMFHKMEN
jgi:hypothetical protein